MLVRRQITPHAPELREMKVAHCVKLRVCNQPEMGQIATLREGVGVGEVKAEIRGVDICRDHPEHLVTPGRQ